MAIKQDLGGYMLGSPDFSGKAVLVTGAASGLGLATAKTLAQLGAELCLVDVNVEGLDAAAAGIRQRGGKAHALPLDLSERPNCAAAVDGAVERMGGLDALCNVAGIIATAHFTDMTPERYDRLMAVNLAAPYFLAQRAIPHLLARNGAIVNVASSSAYMGHAYLTAYAASKAALISLTKSLAVEYGRQSLRVSAVAPGGMETPLVASGGGFPADADFTLLQRIAGLRGGMVPVEEVAEMIAILASDRGGAYHGACVQIDGGITSG
jgi:NAD(P)-dependent dehydrogenase (short-subunit alcohol dehydrogenase family)